MDLYDIAIARKLADGSGGGGGGSSDFSTAEMTITATGYPGCNNSTYVYLEDAGALIPLSTRMANGETVEILLIKGNATGVFYTAAEITTYNGSITLGESEYEDDTYYTPFTITGDCSVTLVGWND